MIKLSTKGKLNFAVLFAVAIFLSSCGTSQNVVYFSNLDSAGIKQVQLPEFKQPTIQVDDILEINVQTLGQNAFAASSMGSTTTAISTVSATNTAGLLVNKDGKVEVPMLGTLKLVGLTTSQAAEIVRVEAVKFYKDPTVQVRYVNFKVTVIGEVKSPSTYTVMNEKVTVIDALALAGDLTSIGKRSNVLLMRDNGDKKDIIHLDLNSSSVVSSPFYYLRQNDIIYVQPMKGKVDINSSTRAQLIAIGISVITLGITIFSQLK